MLEIWDKSQDFRNNLQVIWGGYQSSQKRKETNEGKQCSITWRTVSGNKQEKEEKQRQRQMKDEKQQATMFQKLNGLLFVVWCCQPQALRKENEEENHTCTFSTKHFMHGGYIHV